MNFLSREGLAFWLTAIPGLVGIFGLGHFYVHERRRGYAFLSVTAVLAVLVSIAFLAPAYLPPLLGAPGMPAIWFGGWVASMWDIRNLMKRGKIAERVPRLEQQVIAK
jgi:hypothetical protein